MITSSFKAWHFYERDLCKIWEHFHKDIYVKSQSIFMKEICMQSGRGAFIFKRALYIVQQF